MRKLLLALAGAAVSASAFAVPTVVFRAMPWDPTRPDVNVADGSTTQYFFPPAVGDEIGDEVTLAAGTPRNITEMTVQLATDFTATSTPSARVRLYAMNGPAVGTRADSPGTIIWDSGAVAIPINDSSLRLIVPNVTVPDRFTWTLEAIGTTQVAADQFGPWNYGPPMVGTTDLNLWGKVAGTWTNFDYPTQNADLAGNAGAGRAAPCMAMSMYADGGPIVPYDSLLTYTPVPGTGNAHVSHSNGGFISLEGNNRRITKFQIHYRTDVTLPQGDEMLTMYFHNELNDGSYSADLLPFYTSPTIPLDATGTSAVSKLATFDLGAGVDVPDKVVWRVNESGFGTGNSNDGVAGDRFITSATSKVMGGSNPAYWMILDDLGSAWTNVIFSGPSVTPTTDNLGYPGGQIQPFMAVKLSAEKRIEHSSTSVGPGSTASGATNNITSYSPDARWGIRPGAVLVATADKIVATVNFYLPVATVGTMTVTVESKATVANIRQKVDIKSGTSASFTNLETFTGLPIGANPDRMTTLAVGTPNSFIDATQANKVVIRLSANNTTAVLVYPWQYQVDACYIDIT